MAKRIDLARLYEAMEERKVSRLAEVATAIRTRPAEARRIAQKKKHAKAETR